MGEKTIDWEELIYDLWDISNSECTHDWFYLVGDDGTMQCEHCGSYQN